MASLTCEWFKLLLTLSSQWLWVMNSETFGFQLLIKLHFVKKRLYCPGKSPCRYFGIEELLSASFEQRRRQVGLAWYNDSNGLSHDPAFAFSFPRIWCYFCNGCLTYTLRLMDIHGQENWMCKESVYSWDDPVFRTAARTLLFLPNNRLELVGG